MADPSIDALIQAALGGGSVDHTPNVGLNPATGQYEYFTIGPEGKPIFQGVQAPPVNMHPGESHSTSSSTSFNTSQQIADPAVIAQEIQKEQDQVAQWNVQNAQHAQDQQYLQQQNQWAQRNGDKRLALDSQSQLATIQNQRDTLTENIRQSMQRSNEMQQQLAVNVAEFNAQGEQTAQKNNLDFQTERNRQIQQTNADIGTLGQDTGNRGRFAAFATAARPFAGAISALGNTSLIDDTSAKPLEDSLRNRQTLMNENPNPYNFNSISVPPLALSPVPTVPGPLSAASAVNPEFTRIQNENAVKPTDQNTDALVAGNQNALGALLMAGYTPANTNANGDIPHMADGGFVPRNGTAVQPGHGNLPTPDWAEEFATHAALHGYTSDPNKIFDTFNVPDTVSGELRKRFVSTYNTTIDRVRQSMQQAGDTPVGLPAAAHGGTMQGAFIAGDSPDGQENPEVVIPMGDGTMVVSLKGMQPDAIKAAKGRLQKFATGGLFDNLTDSPLSKQFLTQASQTFREGSPWAGQSGYLPSAVYGSSPGFNPDVNSFLSSGRALEQGIPTSFSDWLSQQAGAMGYKSGSPYGLTARPVGRTA